MVAQNMKKSKTNMLWSSWKRRMRAVISPWARCQQAAATSCAPVKRHGRYKDAVGTLCVRCADVVYTLLLANLIFWAYFAATSQRADRFSVRYTSAVALPFGVTGALSTRISAFINHMIVHFSCSYCRQNGYGPLWRWIIIFWFQW